MRSQPAVNRVGVFAIDLNFFKDGELDIVILIDKLPDIFMRSRFLALELIAREGQDFESFIFELFSDLVELFIIWIGVGTQARNIDDQ